MPKVRKEIPELERLVQTGRKKFVRYEEGAQLYSMGLHTFQELAKDAKAVYHLKRVVLINTEIIDEYNHLHHMDLNDTKHYCLNLNQKMSCLLEIQKHLLPGIPDQQNYWKMKSNNRTYNLPVLPLNHQTLITRFFVACIQKRISEFVSASTECDDITESI